MKEFNEAMCALDKAERLLVEARIEIGKAWSATQTTKPTPADIIKQADAVERAVQVLAYASPGSDAEAELRVTANTARAKLREMIHAR